MARKQRKGRSRILSGVLLGLTAIGLGGCLKSAVVVEKPVVEKRQASRDQLLGILMEQMNHFATVKAAIRFDVAVQNIMVPATMSDYVYMQSGKAYQKKFLQTQVEGQLLLVREPEGTVRIRASGEIGEEGEFMLLGKGNSFWILQPTTKAEQDEAIQAQQSAPRGRVLYGTLESESIRPKNALSVRPQDIANLLLSDEVYPAVQGPDICYVETWPDYYVMNFLRQGWPEHIYSKVWIEREHLTVAIHQLYDGTGEVIAEGRFKNYAFYSGTNSKLSVQLPSDVEILWPRDKIVLRAELKNVQVNEAIAEKFFDENVLLKSYPATRIQSPQPATPIPAP